MEIVAVGLNHEAAPVEIREQLAFSPALRATAQAALLRQTAENVIISTCNRSEVYAVTADGVDGATTLVDFLGEFHRLPREAFAPYLYVYQALGAIDHLFNVAAGLDSMILGEPQILGQVREAYDAAAEQHAAGPVLCRAFSQALKVGKRVRSETGIARHAVSVSYAAVELARSIFGGLAGRRVLLVGAGKMGELAARTLLDNGLTGLTVTNRTHARAMELAARFGGNAAAFAHLPQLLAEADAVITSTSAPGFVLTSDIVRQAMAGRADRPLFVVDIAVPRDVDPAVRDLAGVFLYDVDELRAVCTANLEERRKETALARQIVAGEVADFAAWWDGLRAVPTISALRRRLETIRQAEMRKALARCGDLSEQQRDTVEVLTCAIVNKILHQPVTRLKATSGNADGAQYNRLVRELFALDMETP